MRASHEPCIFEKFRVYVTACGIDCVCPFRDERREKGQRGGGWAAHFSFERTGEICADLRDGVSLELGYLLYSYAELGTEPRVNHTSGLCHHQ